MDCLHLMQRCRLGLATLLVAVAAALTPLHAQTPPSFDRVEYFLDTDPGFGLATAATLPAMPGSVLAALSFPVDLTAVAPGFHNLFIRSRAGVNGWSQTFKQLLYVSTANASGPAPNINWAVCRSASTACSFARAT